MATNPDDLFTDDALDYSPDQYRFDPLPDLLDALDRLSARCIVGLDVPDGVAAELRDLTVALRRQLRRPR